MASEQPTKQKLWGGRFTGKTDPLFVPTPSARLQIYFPDTQFCRMHAFNQSLKYDQRMYAADIKGSIAYAKSLTLVGILTKEEEDKITNGLALVGKEWQDGVVRITFRRFLKLHIEHTLSAVPSTSG